MNSSVARWLVALCAILVMPLIAYAQETSLVGTVTDTTGAVMPGVTVTATNETTGNTFMAVTDGRGAYRIAARVGGYRLTAELSGFRTVTRTGIELLVGQTVSVNLQLTLGSVSETVTVKGESPLLNTATSNLGGNVDPRQVQELPVPNRNWMGLTVLAPGSRTTSTMVDQPLPDRRKSRDFQLSIDGQQVSSDLLPTFTQPRFSQDSIAEFQFIANRFDASLGRATQVQVVAVTKSGTNTVSGLFRGNFSDARWGAANPIVGSIVPDQQQQYSSAVGGPIVQNRLHYFVNGEYDRHPLTSVWTTPYSAFNAALSSLETRKIGGVRIDYQLSQKVRLMGKVSGQHSYTPFGAASSTTAAASTVDNDEKNSEYLGQLTHVISNRALNEIRGGWSHYGFATNTLVNWSNHWQAPSGITNGYPRILFTGFSINANMNAPRHRDQSAWTIRDDFTYSYDAAGRHDVKLGAELLYRIEDSLNCAQCGGTINATRRPQGLPVAPTADMLAAWFPDQFNADTWNLAAISPWVTNYTIGVGHFPITYAQPRSGVWLQDDWHASSRLTLNLGVRYDLFLNQWANTYGFGPSNDPGRYFEANRPNDYNTLQPRLGFAWQLNEKAVIRGGAGLFYTSGLTVDAFWPQYTNQIARIQITNDGRANFAADPFNGRPLPTLEQATKLFCDAPEQAVSFAAWAARRFSGPAPCLLNSGNELAGPTQYMHMPRAFNISIGIQQQLGQTMSVQVDYVHSLGSHEKDILDNANLAYNPATGANYAFVNANRGLLPWPSAGAFGIIDFISDSRLESLQTSFTRRLSHRWQASATYTLSWFYDMASQPMSGREIVPFSVQPDLGGDGSFGLSASDQRHRATFNGIWQAGKGLQISGLHFMLVGERAATAYGGDLRQTGVSGGFGALLRPDGTLVPRNWATQPSRNRTDLRIQQRIPLRGRMSIDAIAEVFNVFNRPNWVVNFTESAANYLQNASGENRTVQVGFRVIF